MKYTESGHGQYGLEWITDPGGDMHVEWFLTEKDRKKARKTYSTDGKKVGFTDTWRSEG